MEVLMRVCVFLVVILGAWQAVEAATIRDGKIHSFLNSKSTNDTIKDFFTKPWAIPVVAGGGAIFLISLVLIVISICCCYKRRTCCFRPSYAPMEKQRLISNYTVPDARYTNGGGPMQVEVGYHGRSLKQRERTVAEELRRQKQEQEQQDRDSAKYIVEFFLRNDKRFEMMEHLPDMGSRMLKFWFRIKDEQRRGLLLTIAPVSQKCPLTLDNATVKTLNKLLSMLSHPNLHPVMEINYLSDRRQVIIIQPPSGHTGSLKDLIYKATPYTEWTLKYSRRSRGLSTHAVAQYGKQILEAIKYLYGQGFPPLGHIQTGNIFVEGEICRLGGYENTLLGYKTRSFKICKPYLDTIDLILFGHVIFEMACGYELTHVSPVEQDYKSVKDRRVREILHVIFEMSEEGEFTSNIEDVSNHPFFQEARLPIQDGARCDHTQFPSDVKKLLIKVAKDKPRDQKAAKKRRKKLDHQQQSGVAEAALPTSSAGPVKGATTGPSSPSDADLSKSKTAVLDCIREERPHLKKTVTNDRSAPKLH